MSAPLVDVPQTIGSIVVAGLGMIISTATLVNTSRRAFGSNQFLSSDLAVSHTRSRMQLLFIASLLAALDCLRSVVYYSITLSLADPRSDPNLLVNAQKVSRIVYMITFIPAPAFLTLACCQRCAVVSVHSPEWRRRLLRVAMALCSCCVAIIVASAAWIMYTLIQTNPAPAVWRATLFIPTFISPLLAVFPAISLIGTFLALRVAFVDPGSVSASGSIHAGGGSSGGGGGGDGGGGKSAGARSLEFKMARPASISFRLAAHGATSQGTGTLRRHSGNTAPVVHGVRYLLSFSFKVLSVGIVVVWIFILFTVFNSTTGAIRSNGLCDLMLSLGVLIEALFELFIRAKSRRVRKKGGGGATEHFETVLATADMERPPTIQEEEQKQQQQQRQLEQLQQQQSLNDVPVQEMSGSLA
ncbi:hypothetical protein BC828DRAFT_388034 [Blastocladiella britannica]|nr:hypothetical protein BC828DRAFT_388034 [Blastocladiella britannica]